MRKITIRVNRFRFKCVEGLSVPFSFDLGRLSNFPWCLLCYVCLPLPSVPVFSLVNPLVRSVHFYNILLTFLLVWFVCIDVLSDHF